ncbi:probable palmitoyltransferase ZDHHC24 [Drosophila kikkawai]|uniref:Palmitoyltransferase n=1 Tax=Drosophila kikkawai TaxID=30033 RepID=A0A6P4IUM7_DROKI|nr:probable palmitoyltransferase ZDHHC24 [Drosophila kikkawai]
MIGLRRLFIIVLCWTRRMCVQSEDSFLRCTRRHRLKIVNVIHPISAIVLLGVIGFTLVYEVMYVGPEILGSSGCLYWLGCLFAGFVIFNILGNWWLSFKTDTTVNSLPAEQQTPAEGEAHLWHYCIACDRLVPPRSWHCRLCQGCMLKRDHHCTISGSCIGHKNQRYFICFLFHLTLGCGSALVFNGIYAWKTGSIMTADPIMLFFKMSDYSKDVDLDWKYTISIIFKLNMFLFVIALFMFCVQILMVHRNSTCYKILDRSYDLGWRRNFEGVLGKQLFWTLLSPTIISPLTNDGTKWFVKQHV